MISIGAILFLNNEYTAVDWSNDSMGYDTGLEPEKFSPRRYHPGTQHHLFHHSKLIHKDKFI